MGVLSSFNTNTYDLTEQCAIKSKRRSKGRQKYIVSYCKKKKKSQRKKKYYARCDNIFGPVSLLWGSSYNLRERNSPELLTCCEKGGKTKKQRSKLWECSFTFEYMKKQYFWISALTHQDCNSTEYKWGNFGQQSPYCHVFSSGQECFHCYILSAKTDFLQKNSL